MDWINNMPFAMSKSLARQTLLSMNKEPEPLPEIWDWFWDTMPLLKAGKKGEPLGLGDVARTFKVNIEQIFGSIPAPDGAPLAAADVEGLDFKALFLGMKTYFDRYGSVFKMCFGPKVRARMPAASREEHARTHAICPPSFIPLLTHLFFASATTTVLYGRHRSRRRQAHPPRE